MTREYREHQDSEIDTRKTKEGNGFTENKVTSEKCCRSKIIQKNVQKLALVTCWSSFGKLKGAENCLLWVKEYMGVKKQRPVWTMLREARLFKGKGRL